MQKRHLLITLLLLAHVLVGLILWSMDDSPRGHVIHHMLFGLFGNSQVVLSAIWMALGRRATPWRLAALVAAIVGWSWSLSWIEGGDPYGVFYFLAQAVTVVAVLALARFLGLRLYTIDAEPTDIEDDRAWQFSLARLFAWTTSLTICLGLLILTGRHCHEWSAVSGSGIPVLTLVSTVVVLIGLWLFLTDFRLRISISLVVILLFGYALYFHLRYFMLLLFVLPTQPVTPTIHENFIFLLSFVLQIPPLFATLLVFRVAGYRLRWKRYVAPSFMWRSTGEGLGFAFRRPAGHHINEATTEISGRPSTHGPGSSVVPVDRSGPHRTLQELVPSSPGQPQRKRWLCRSTHVQATPEWC